MMRAVAANTITTKTVVITIAVVISAATAAVVVIPEVVVLWGAIGSSATMLTSQTQKASEIDDV